jgi:hypothetical protein
MTSDILREIAQTYNRALRGAIMHHNEKRRWNRSNRDYIFDLTNDQDIRELNDLGIPISCVQVPNLKNPYETAGGDVIPWVNRNLKEGKIGYRPGVMPQEHNLALAQLVDAPEYQRGICVVGKNTGDKTFEVHTTGAEGLIPWFFDGFTLLASGFNFNNPKEAVNRNTARLVHLPAMPENVYVLEKKGRVYAAHYAPHLLAVAEIILPIGTNYPELSSFDKYVNNVYGKKGPIISHRNKPIATTDDTPEANRTIARVRGDCSDRTEILRIFQREIVERVARPLLEAKL